MIDSIGFIIQSVVNYFTRENVFENHELARPKSALVRDENVKMEHKIVGCLLKCKVPDDPGIPGTYQMLTSSAG